MVLDGHPPGGRRWRASTAATSASPCSGSCDYLTGRTVRVRAEPRGRRRVAADLRVARRDGRRVGAVRGVGAPAARRHRHRARVRLGQVVAGRSPSRCIRCSSTRTTSRRSASTRGRSPRCRRGRCSTPGKATERDFAEVVARNRAQRDRQPERAGEREFDVDELLAEPYVRAPLRAPRPAADLRRRGRGRARRRRQGARRWASGRRGSAASTTASRSTSPACATSPCRRRPRWPAEGAGSTTGPVEVAELSATFRPQELDPARRARPRRRRRRQPVGRRARRQPGDGHRPRPHHRGRPRRSPSRAATACLAHATGGQACNRTSSASWRDRES